ncbi:MAG: DUF397 domain-containing protein [Pseudonocardiales bacterium]|nr:DUF397 domain-containing protein [Pseudonocardiales bacterium]
MTEQEQQRSLLWKKSTASGNSGCVEVARTGKMTLVRDSKAPSGPFLTFKDAIWKNFCARADEFKN